MGRLALQRVMGPTRGSGGELEIGVVDKGLQTEWGVG